MARGPADGFSATARKRAALATEAVRMHGTTPTYAAQAAVQGPAAGTHHGRQGATHQRARPPLLPTARGGPWPMPHEGCKATAC